MRATGGVESAEKHIPCHPFPQQVAERYANSRWKTGTSSLILRHGCVVCERLSREPKAASPPMKGGWVLEKGTQMNIYVGNLPYTTTGDEAGDVVLQARHRRAGFGDHRPRDRPPPRIRFRRDAGQRWPQGDRGTRWLRILRPQAQRQRGSSPPAAVVRALSVVTTPSTARTSLPFQTEGPYRAVGRARDTWDLTTT